MAKQTKKQQQQSVVNAVIVWRSISVEDRTQRKFEQLLTDGGLCNAHIVNYYDAQFAQSYNAYTRHLTEAKKLGLVVND